MSNTNPQSGVMPLSKSASKKKKNLMGQSQFENLNGQQANPYLLDMSVKQLKGNGANSMSILQSVNANNQQFNQSMLANLYGNDETQQQLSQQKSNILLPNQATAHKGKKKSDLHEGSQFLPQNKLINVPSGQSSRELINTFSNNQQPSHHQVHLKHQASAQGTLLAGLDAPHLPHQQDNYLAANKSVA